MGNLIDEPESLPYERCALPYPSSVMAHETISCHRSIPTHDPMKPSLKTFDLFKFAVSALTIALACSNQVIAGSITGDTLQSDNLIWWYPAKARLNYYGPAGNIGYFTADIVRPYGEFYWRQSNFSQYKMAIKNDNSLALYKAGTASTLGVSINPNTGAINLNGINIGGGNNSLELNTALGKSTLTSVTTGDQNTAVGATALASNTAGINNSAVGAGALGNNLGNGVAGSNNTAVGAGAGASFGPVAPPAEPPVDNLTSASLSVYLGAWTRALTNTDTNSIVIGANAVSKGSNTTVIGTAATTETHLAGKTITNELSVAGVTTLNGQVILAAPQGDISMGEYGN